MVRAGISPVRFSRASPGPSAHGGARQHRRPARHASAKASAAGRWWRLARQGLADVIMVLLWAAMVPATLWLGVAAGF
ncbi:hypothetical protein [Castellaniella sp.]|uniref:hypothetical protein n=1 Tax=Castellaniella sp. TaxID=1955812 RepID=UPI00355EDF03